MLILLTSERLPRLQNPSDPGPRVPMEGANGTMFVGRGYQNTNLNLDGRHIVLLQGYVPDTAQREKICKLARQVIAKICSFADGVSLVLDANGFEITKNILDALSNITRFLLPKSDHPRWKHIYGVEKKDDGEKIDLVFKRLIVALSSTCKVLFKLAPQLTRLQAPLKLLPHVSLVLDIIELGLNYKNFTKDGLTAKNVSKIAAALCYHAVSSATFAVAGGSGVILALGFAIHLAMYFSWLVDEGMKDTALIMQPIDKLWLSKWLVKKVYSFCESAYLDHSFQYQVNWGRMICLSVIGLNLCRSAASAVVKLIRDSRKTSETDIAETMLQRREIVGIQTSQTQTSGGGGAQ